MLIISSFDLLAQNDTYANKVKNDRIELHKESLEYLCNQPVINTEMIDVIQVNGSVYSEGSFKLIDENHIIQRTRENANANEIILLDSLLFMPGLSAMDFMTSHFEEDKVITKASGGDGKTLLKAYQLIY